MHNGERDSIRSFPDSADGRIKREAWLSIAFMVLPAVLYPFSSGIPIHAPWTLETQSLAEEPANEGAHSNPTHVGQFIPSSTTTLAGREKVHHGHSSSESTSVGAAFLDSLGVTLNGVFPPDDRKKVTPTTDFPWSAIVKLYAWRGGHVVQCSGVMIDAFHVLTAGHCLQDWSFFPPEWVDSVEVVPAMDNGSRPFGEAWATQYRTPPEFTPFDGFLFLDLRHDWAVITLDRNVGTFTGWMRLMAAPQDDPSYVGPLHTTGFPGDLDMNVWTMYHTSGPGCWADEYEHGTWLDEAPGQSGSPVWVLNGSDHLVVSVVSRGGLNETDCNVGTRLTPERLENLSLWVTADPPPLDYPDLSIFRYTYGSFAPELVAPEISQLTISSRLRNKGTAASGGFRVSYYLAPHSLWEEPTIDDDTFLIGGVDVPPLEPFEVRDLQWAGAVPIGVPSGRYWVAWVIDSGNAVVEFNEDENVVFIRPTPLIVDAAPPRTVVNITGSAGVEGWYRSTVHLALHVTDDLSGTHATVYRLDSGPWTPYVASFDVRSEGPHLLEYYSADVAENVEPTSQTAFGIDLAPPRNLTVVSPAQGEIVHTSSVEAHYEGTDVLSGIEGYFVRLDDGVAMPSGVSLSCAFTGVADGPHEMRVTAVDKAGNEAYVITSFRVDTNPLSLSGPFGPVPIVVVLATAVAIVVLVWIRHARTRKGLT